MSDETFLNDIKPSEDQPFLAEVLTHTGDHYLIDRPVPGEDGTKIIRMFVPDDTTGDVFVYALPLVGTPHDTMKAGLEYVLPGISIRRRMSLAKLNIWKEMVAGACGELEATCPRCKQSLEDPDDEPEETAEPIVGTGGSFPSVSTNGAS